MELTDKDIKKISLIILIVALGILVFVVIRPVVLSIIAGLLLAYIFAPVHKFFTNYIKSPTFSAIIVSILILAIIIIPVWFATPVLIRQAFDSYQIIQQFNLQTFVKKIFPNISEQILAQVSISFDSSVSKFTTTVLNGLANLLLDFPKIALHLLLVAFVFFFTLKDREYLKQFVSGLSPLSKSQEKELVHQFKSITESIVYGQIILGLAQGILAGIGFLIFGVPNALILTILAILLSIIPMVGPAFVYIPVFLYLAITVSNPVGPIIFLLYNLLIVSTIDNVLRAHIVSKRTDFSQVVILVGMIGGLFFFGFLGLILGPLILAYFVTFLREYKQRNLSSVFPSTAAPS